MKYSVVRICSVRMYGSSTGRAPFMLTELYIYICFPVSHKETKVKIRISHNLLIDVDTQMPTDEIAKNYFMCQN